MADPVRLRCRLVCCSVPPACRTHHDAFLHRAERQEARKSVFYATGFIGFFFL